MTGNRLYGGFGAKPKYAAAFRLDNGNVGSQVWRYGTVGNVQTVALAPDNSRLFLGGHFGIYRLRQSVCGQPLHGLFTVNSNSGAPICDWIPSIEPFEGNTQGPWDMVATGTALWVGGGFTGVSGTGQSNLARFTYGTLNHVPQVDLDGYKPGGLDATYFDNINFTGLQISCVDPTVNFDFGTNSPHPNIGPDTFSARWTGQIEAPATGLYTFTTRSDDGVRLLVDGMTLVDNFTDHGPTDDTGTIALEAGKRYDIYLDYYENTGDRSSSSCGSIQAGRGRWSPQPTCSARGASTTRQPSAQGPDRCPSWIQSTSPSPTQTTTT